MVVVGLEGAVAAAGPDVVWHGLVEDSTVWCEFWWWWWWVVVVAVASCGVVWCCVVLCGSAWPGVLLSDVVRQSFCGGCCCCGPGGTGDRDSPARGPLSLSNSCADSGGHCAPLHPAHRSVGPPRVYIIAFSSDLGGVAGLDRTEQILQERLSLFDWLLVAGRRSG